MGKGTSQGTMMTLSCQVRARGVMVSSRKAHYQSSRVAARLFIMRMVDQRSPPYCLIRGGSDHFGSGVDCARVPEW